MNGSFISKVVAKLDFNSMNQEQIKERTQNLESRIDRIIEWVKTCDNKATTLLSITALVLTILLSGDYIMTGMQTILSTVYDPNMTEPSICGILAVLSFITAVILLLLSLVCCILVVRAKVSENQRNQPSIKTDSLIHFNNIASLSYSQFVEAIDRETDEDYLEDLKSQIYINASRCTEKFKIYNNAVLLLCCAIPFAVLYIVFTVLFLAQL